MDKKFEILFSKDIKKKDFKHLENLVVSAKNEEFIELIEEFLETKQYESILILEKFLCAYRDKLDTSYVLTLSNMKIEFFRSDDEIKRSLVEEVEYIKSINKYIIEDIRERKKEISYSTHYKVYKKALKKKSDENDSLYICRVEALDKMCSKHNKRYKKICKNFKLA